jgi:hypothetical protein
MTERHNCTMLPAYTCFHNPGGKIKSLKRVGLDPGACCKACSSLEGCVSWTHSSRGGGGCNLYKVSFTGLARIA